MQEEGNKQIALFKCVSAHTAPLKNVNFLITLISFLKVLIFKYNRFSKQE